MFTIELLDKPGIATAQAAMIDRHYLHKPVDARCSVEGYRLYDNIHQRIAGWLLFGRPQATRCADWYGSVDDVRLGYCEVTRWQVLNLARVLIHPDYQAGGALYSPDILPGFIDRRGVWRSTLASSMIEMALDRVGYDYLTRRPPCFLEEPYQIEWVLSYCNTHLHRGVIYRAAGFELFHTKNTEGIQTWRKRIAPLTKDQDAIVCQTSWLDKRAGYHRSRRAQMEMEFA